MSYNKNNPETIQSMFDSIAKNYDRTNAVLSLGMHNYWNGHLIDQIFTKEHPKTILDLCCGTGAISLSYLSETSKPIKAYLLDFSGGMLKYAQKRAEKLPIMQHQIEYLQADAQQIPLMSDSIDCVTMAYGIRNIKQPQDCISEIHRVLKKNGTVGILELTQPSNSFMRLGHAAYLKLFLPVLGKLMTTNGEAYQYLNQSIKSFIPPQKLKEMLASAGFKDITCTPLTGGVATLIKARKN